VIRGLVILSGGGSERREMKNLFTRTGVPAVLAFALTAAGPKSYASFSFFNAGGGLAGIQDDTWRLRREETSLDACPVSNERGKALGHLAVGDRVVAAGFTDIRGRHEMFDSSVSFHEAAEDVSFHYSKCGLHSLKGFPGFRVGVAAEPTAP
jgi:hypothetical protein